MRPRLGGVGRSSLGGGFGRLSGVGSLARGRAALALPPGLEAEPGSWRRWLRWVPWVALPLLLVAVVLISESLTPDPPRAPDVAVKPWAFPAVDPHLPEAPPWQLEGPSPATSAPNRPGSAPVPQPEPYVPDPTPAPVEPDRTETIHELTVHHIHRLQINWIWDWIAIGAIGALFFFMRQLLRRRLPGRYVIAGVVALAALALSGLAVAAGVNQLRGDGILEPHPRVVTDEHRDSDGDLIIEEEKPIDHYHPPLELDVAFLLLAAALADLSVPSGRVAVAGVRRWIRSEPRRSPPTSS